MRQSGLQTGLAWISHFDHEVFVKHYNTYVDAVESWRSSGPLGPKLASIFLHPTACSQCIRKRAVSCVINLQRQR